MELKRFVIGSKVFFDKYEDFNPVDTDILIIETDNSKLYDAYPQTSYWDEENRIHTVVWANISKEELFNYHLYDCYAGRYIQKFLCPEYVKYFNITIDELKSLHRLIDILDYEHTYVKIIYDAYIANNDFVLTDEQLDAAYAEYKRTRG